MKTSKLTPAVSSIAARLSREPDRLWFALWCCGMLMLWGWDMIFLNRPALERIERAFANTLIAGLFVLVFATILGWITGVGLYFLDRRGKKTFYLPLTFLLNLIRSIPQIVGILIGYVLLTVFIANGTLRSEYAQIIWMAFVISVFVFLEVADLIRERIEHFSKLDFVQAMLCCGISEARIVNVEVLWKNSLAHLFHKLISLFGVTVFLQCSIDFIVSVGLSTDVSLSNFPVTLGSLLAKMDSKQDILAIGAIFADARYAGQLFVEHLQGVSIAFAIVFTLLCVYKVANGFVRRLRL